MHLRALLFGLLAFLAACAEPMTAPVASSPAGSRSETVFVATTRAPSESEWFNYARSDAISYLSTEVYFPANYKPGDPAGNEHAPDPQEDFRVGARTDYDRAGFETALRAALAGLPPGSRDVTIYTHGYYNGFFRGLFRAAQLKSDFALGGPIVYFAWPSRGLFSAYAYDRESALFSRDAFEDLLRSVARVDADRVTIVAHSLGAMLTMETLRQIDISEPGWVGAEIDGLALISPDIDTRVFKTQAARFARLPDDTVVFVSDRDRMLLLSSRVAGTKDRLGNLTTGDIEVSTEGDMTIVDVSALTQDAASAHYIPMTSPAMIEFMRRSDGFLELFARDGWGRNVNGNVRLLTVRAVAP